MAVLRGSAVVASALGTGMEPRRKIALTGFVLARTPKWSKKPFTIRNVPETVVMPSPLQVAVRYAFGALARKARGVPMKAGEKIDDVTLEGKLPPAAEFISKKKGVIAKAVETVAPLVNEEKDRIVRMAVKREMYQPTIHRLSDLVRIADQLGIKNELEKVIKVEEPKSVRMVKGRLVDLTTKTVKEVAE